MVAGALALAVSAAAQTTNTNMVELRELRVACLESFNNAKTRLDELHDFVGQQAEHERIAANRLFQLRQNAASAKRRSGELELHIRQCTNLLSRSQHALDQATASYRAAADSMPSGEAWAADGSVALNEMKRAADASPRDGWKHKRVKEIEAEYIATLHQWRAARRCMQQASFDLELRAAPGAFQRIMRQIDSAAGELKNLDSQLAEQQATLGKLTEQSEQWGAAIRALCEGELRSRVHLANIAFKFHLVDLKFAAWRLKHSDLGDEGVEALPDAVERSFGSETVGQTDRELTSIPPSNSAGGIAAPAVESAEAPKEERSPAEEGDAAFRDLLARVNLAQARLRFVAEVLQAEFNAVEKGINALEEAESVSQSLVDDTARLAADQESLRRSIQTEQQSLATGAETLDLVKNRFAADLKEINQLLDDSEKRTATLAKNLE